MGELYERYVDAVYRYVHVRTRNHATTEDVCSEVWLRVVRAIPAYAPTGKGFPAWLFAIAHNTTMDQFRSAGRRPSTPQGDMLHLDQPAIEVGPEEAAMRRDVADDMAKAIASLPAKSAEAITLRFFEGLTTAETASVMGTTVNAVKAAQHRGLKALVKILPEEMRILGAALSVKHVEVSPASRSFSTPQSAH